MLNRLRYLLIGATFVQYIIYHTSDIEWVSLSSLLVWIIVLQIGWFMVESPMIRRLVLFVALAIGLAFSHYQRDIYIFMWLLLVLEGFFQLSKRDYVMLSVLITINASLIGYLEMTPLNMMMTLFMIVIEVSLFFLRSYYQDFLELRENYYVYQRERQDQKESTKHLKNHIRTMKDLYVMNERNRISRDIHDSIGHVLSTIIIQLGAITNLTKNTQPQVSQMSQELRDFSAKGLQDIRHIVHEMKPVEFQKLSFIVRVEEMLAEFEHLSGIKVLLNHRPAKWQLGPVQEGVIYRAIQEFVGNSAKHGQASEIRLNLIYTDDSLILNMVDNGQGTDQITPHLGLMGLEERIHHVGGKVSFQSGLGQGFKTRLVLYRGGNTDENPISR